MLPTRQNSFFASVPPVKNMITRIIHSHHCHYGIRPQFVITVE